MDRLSDLRARAAAATWYHTMDLGGGLVTRGLFDHRRLLSRLPIPPRLDGARCLDLASADGLFAFELARRGASEVVSLDLDDTRQQDVQLRDRSRRPEEVAVSTGALERFEVACELLDLEVKRVNANIYDVDVDQLGTFDFVTMGNILLHVRDPIGVLQRVRPLVQGRLLSIEPILLAASLMRPRTGVARLYTNDDDVLWWIHNARGHRRMLEAAEFQVIDSAWPQRQPLGAWRPRRPKALRALRDHPLQQAFYWLWTRPVGVNTGWALAEPATR